MSKCGDRAPPAQDEENMVNEDKSNANTALEHYLKSGQQFGDGEKFYLLGFEAALHARNRCKEFDQIRPRWQATWKNCSSNIPGPQWKNPFRRAFSGDGNITSASATNPTWHDVCRNRNDQIPIASSGAGLLGANIFPALFESR